MITPSFSLTASERVLPKLALDFTTAALDPRITFTRTTSATNPATYVNSSGNIALASNNAPRFDYDPVTLACKGLLIEESRSNSLKYSEQFNDASWTKYLGFVTVLQDDTTAPDGNLTADKLVPTTDNNIHLTFQNVAKSATALTYSFSMYVKAAGYSRMGINIQNGPNGVSATFNLSTLAVTIAGFGTGFTPISAKIEPFSNSWHRVIIVLTSDATVQIGASIYVYNNSGSASFAGDGTSGIYAWGAQLEAGAFPTSYIPTTSAALTRNADVATMTGTNFSDWYNQAQGTLLSDVMLTQVGTTFAYTVSDSTVNNQIYHRELASGGDCAVVTGNVTQAYLTKAYTPAVGSIYQAAIGYAANNIGFTVNAASVVTDTSATIPTVDRICLGGSYNNGAQRSMYLRSFYYWPQRLTNAELQAFTA